MMKKRRQLPPRLSLSAGFTWMGRVIQSRQKTKQQRGQCCYFKKTGQEGQTYPPENGCAKQNKTSWQEWKQTHQCPLLLHLSLNKTAWCFLFSILKIVCAHGLYLSILRFFSEATRNTYVCLRERGQDSPNKSESSHRRREINAGLLIQALRLWRVSGWEEFSGQEAHSNPLDPDKNGIAWIRCLCHHSLCVTLSSFTNITSFLSHYCCSSQTLS